MRIAIADARALILWGSQGRPRTPPTANPPRRQGPLPEFSMETRRGRRRERGKEFQCSNRTARVHTEFARQLNQGAYWPNMPL